MSQTQRKTSRSSGVSRPRIHESSDRAAKAAALKYVSDRQPGIYRRKHGSGFQYVTATGRVITEQTTLTRIRSLVLPPAWRDVWICANPNGHLQAVGVDARGRKQYRYHVRWRQVRDEAKFGRLALFAKTLPRIRRRVRADLKLPGLPKAKVLATLVRLLEKTLIRVGNESYARENGSFGLTTLKNRHARIRGATVEFRFRGKSGVYHEVAFRDPKLALLLKRIQELPGQELFQYADEAGKPRSISSADLNEYLREISGDDFTAKDFRTWAGTLMAAKALQARSECQTAAERKRAVVDVIRLVANHLRNTVAVCRKCYIHPAVMEHFLLGDLRMDHGIARSSAHRLQRQLLRWMRSSSSRKNATP